MSLCTITQRKEIAISSNLIQSNPIQLLIKNIDKNRHHGNLVLCAYVGFVF